MADDSQLYKAYDYVYRDGKFSDKRESRRSIAPRFSPPDWQAKKARLREFLFSRYLKHSFFFFENDAFSKQSYCSSVKVVNAHEHEMLHASVFDPSHHLRDILYFYLEEQNVGTAAQWTANSIYCQKK